MGHAQIEKRKKKGRPSKADLAVRRATEVTAEKSDEHSDIRRSLRRRSFRYNIIDYDEDYLDDDVSLLVQENDDVEERERGSDEEDEERRERKVKLVVKLESTHNNNLRKRKKKSNRVGRVESAGRRGRVESEDEDVDVDVDEEEEEEDEVEVKKRRINGRCDDEDDDDCDDVENGENEEDDEGMDNGEVELKRGECVHGGMPGDKNRSEVPLPDKKLLELILDKLQKKDTYGVYSEPVDPEELPDYHEVIEQPMDFSTVRKKLAKGSYFTMEQFESDVFLISSNAMQYNAPDTVYFKQARAIKELAERKFQRIRLQIEQLEKEPKSEIKCEAKFELKSEVRDIPNSLVKQQPKKPPCRSIQVPVCSDFSSGATLATTDARNTCNSDRVGNVERASNNDGLVEGISFLADSNAEKAEDSLSGKGNLPKFARRSFVVDENRRATYNIPNQPMDRFESILAPFEDEKKQLIPVGLPGEYSYARSLARFAATLGPIAWRIASKRIEQMLPPDFKYGRGWIGEYESLLPVVVVVEGQKEYPFVSRLHEAADSGKNVKRTESIVPVYTHLLIQPGSDGKRVSIFGSEGGKPPTPMVCVSQQQNPPSISSGGPENLVMKRTESNCQPCNNPKNVAVFQQQIQLPRDSVCPANMAAKRREPNAPPTYNQKPDHVVGKHHYGAEMSGKRTESNTPSVSNEKTDNFVQKQAPSGTETPSSRVMESDPNGKNFLQSLPFKQPDANGGIHEGFQNEKSVKNFVNCNRVVASSPGFIPSHLAAETTSFHQRQDQGLSDPVLVMKMLTENAQKLQNGLVHTQVPSQARPPALSPRDSGSHARPAVPSPRGDGETHDRPSVLSPRGDSGSHAAAAAASAWMSVGAAGFRPAAHNSAMSRSLNLADPLYNGMQMFHPQAVQSRVEFPVSATMHFQPEKKGFPFQAFVPQPIKVGNEPQVQNRPMIFPQMVTNDLSRFHMQAPWQGFGTLTQQKPKQDTLPPDLNVAFQSVDSQQPDLALQL